MANTDFDVYGMKLQPGQSEEDADVFEFCRSERIVGVGWGDIQKREYETAKEVHKAHLEKRDRRAEQGKDTGEVISHDRLNAPLRYILYDMSSGDFVWVNEGNDFVLCRVNGDWEVVYNLSEEEFSRYKKHDIIHFRPADWNPIPYEMVPGYVRRRFSGQFGTMQEMSTGITEESKTVLTALHAQEDFETEGSLNRSRIAEKIADVAPDRIFDILGSEETEDIVISYLQSQGWRVIKSSTSSSQADIECELRREEDGESVPGYLQVKTGAAGLKPDSYQDYADAGRMFFFVQSGVSAEGRKDMIVIDPETIHDYMISDYQYLPSDSLLKLDYML